MRKLLRAVGTGIVLWWVLCHACAAGLDWLRPQPQQPWTHPPVLQTLSAPGIESRDQPAGTGLRGGARTTPARGVSYEETLEGAPSPSGEMPAAESTQTHVAIVTNPPVEVTTTAREVSTVATDRQPAAGPVIIQNTNQVNFSNVNTGSPAACVPVGGATERTNVIRNTGPGASPTAAPEPAITDPVAGGGALAAPTPNQPVVNQRGGTASFHVTIQQPGGARVISIGGTDGGIEISAPGGSFSGPPGVTSSAGATHEKRDEGRSPAPWAGVEKTFPSR